MASADRSLGPMITCREFEDFLGDYLEGRLAWGARWRFRLHMWMCPECRRYLRSFRRSLELGRRVFAEPDESVPSEVPPELLRAVLAAVRTPDDGDT